MHSQIQITFNPRRATLRLEGELDLKDRVELRRRLEDVIALGCVRLDVDGTGVTFIDSGCLRELDAARARMTALGRSLVVRRASPVFERVADVADRRQLLPRPGSWASAPALTEASTARLVAGRASRGA